MPLNKANISLRNNTTAGYNNVTDADGISEAQYNTSILEIAEFLGALGITDISGLQAALDARLESTDIDTFTKLGAITTDLVDNVISSIGGSITFVGSINAFMGNNGWTIQSGTNLFRVLTTGVSITGPLTNAIDRSASAVTLDYIQRAFVENALAPNVSTSVDVVISVASTNADVAFGGDTVSNAGSARAEVQLQANAGEIQVSEMYSFRYYYVEIVQDGTGGRSFAGWGAGGTTSYTFSGDIGASLLRTAANSITKYRLWKDHQDVVHVERLNENEVDNGINGLTIQTGTVSIPFLNSTIFRRYSLSLGENITVSFADAAFRTGYSIVVTVTGAARTIIWPTSVASVTSAVAAITGASWTAGTNTLILPVGIFELGIDFDGTNDLLKVVGPYE